MSERRRPIPSKRLGQVSQSAAHARYARRIVAQERERARREREEQDAREQESSQ